MEHSFTFWLVGHMYTLVAIKIHLRSNSKKCHTSTHQSVKIESDESLFIPKTCAFKQGERHTVSMPTSAFRCQHDIGIGSKDPDIILGDDPSEEPSTMPLLS